MTPPRPDDPDPGVAAELASVALEPPPDRLRLDELLRELGARDLVAGAPERAGDLALGDIVDKAAEAGFGFLVAVLTLVAIPFVGLSTPFGLAIATLGLQLMLGRKRPWLPARLCRRRISLHALDRVLAILTKRTRWLAKSTRRRITFAVTPRGIGLGIVFLALGLALPLPIPGSNLVFLVPLFVYAVGLLEQDGLWILVAHLMSLVDAALLVLFGATVLAVLARLWHWIV